MMAFKSAFIAHAPDANPKKHKTRIETSNYELFVRLVKNQNQAVEVCRKLANDGIHSILLCPGFTHENIAEISDTVGDKVGVFVARGDSPSNEIAERVMEREEWFSEMKE